MTDFHVVDISYSFEKDICPKLPHLRWDNFGHILVLLLSLWRSAEAGIQNKLLYHCYTFGKGGICCKEYWKFKEKS